MPTEQQQQTPALAHLVGTCFHSGWADEFNDDEWAAVEAFVSGSPGSAAKLPADVARVLVQCPSDAEVEEYLDSLGCAYTTTPDEGGYRGWLTEVAGRVSAATSPRGGGPNSR